MSVIAVCSVSASPGVTTTVLALAAVWPDDGRLLVVEADVDGGVVAARTGIEVEPGLVTLGASGRHGLDVDEVDRHIQKLPPGEVDVTGRFGRRGRDSPDAGGDRRAARGRASTA